MLVRVEPQPQRRQNGNLKIGRVITAWKKETSIGFMLEIIVFFSVVDVIYDCGREIASHMKSANIFSKPYFRLVKLYDSPIR